MLISLSVFADIRKVTTTVRLLRSYRVGMLLTFCPSPMKIGGQIIKTHLSNKHVVTLSPLTVTTQQYYVCRTGSHQVIRVYLRKWSVQINDLLSPRRETCQSMRVHQLTGISNISLPRLGLHCFSFLLRPTSSFVS